MDEIQGILKSICRKGTESYKCYDVLKHLLTTNESFRRTISNGISEGTIRGFSDELWRKLNDQNLRFRGINNFDDIFKNGFNLGSCTPCSKQVSYSLDNCYICGGTLPILKGTCNCPNGEHTWIEYKGKILDTTLMLDIDSSSILGYNEENRYNPNDSDIYCAAKEFANDHSFKKKRA